MNWLARKIDLWLFARRLERNLIRRKDARVNGRVFVASYTRKKV